MSEINTAYLKHLPYHLLMAGQYDELINLYQEVMDTMGHVKEYTSFEGLKHEIEHIKDVLSRKDIPETEESVLCLELVLEKLSHRKGLINDDTLPVIVDDWGDRSNDVRVLPIGKGSNSIVTRNSYMKMVKEARELNLDLPKTQWFQYPAWDALAQYNPE